VSIDLVIIFMISCTNVKESEWYTDERNSQASRTSAQLVDRPQSWLIFWFVSFVFFSSWTFSSIKTHNLLHYY